MLRAALLLGIINVVCFAQNNTGNVTPTQAKTPLTEDERTELLKLIRSLQERVEKLEAAQGANSQAASQPVEPPAPLSSKPDPSTSDDPHVWMPPVVKEKPASEAADTSSYGRYTPNLGYKLANTEYGDLSISIYTYARYLNQLGLKSSFTGAF